MFEKIWTFANASKYISKDSIIVLDSTFLIEEMFNKQKIVISSEG